MSASWSVRDQEAGLFDALSSSEEELDEDDLGAPGGEWEVTAREREREPPPSRGRQVVEEEEEEERGLEASPYAPHARVDAQKQRQARAIAEAQDAAAQLRRRLRSEKDLRARAEERLAASDRSVESLTAALADAKRRAKAAGGARRGAATSSIMLAEASAAKSRAEAEALRLKLEKQEGGVAKHQRARKAAEARMARLIEDKTALLREMERLQADLAVAQLDAVPAESVRVIMNDALSQRQEASASDAQARWKRAEAVAQRRVAAARVASLRATIRAWGQCARQSVWIKQKAMILSEEAAAAVAEVERESESEIVALNLELEQGLAQLSEENASEVAALSARLSAEEDANRRAQVEIAELRRQLGDEAATSRRAEQLAEQVSHEVDDLRGMVSKAERLKRDLRLADARAEAAEGELRSLRSRVVVLEEDQTEQRKLQFALDEAQTETKRLKARLGARSSSAGAAHTLATQQIEDYKRQIAEHAARAAGMERLLKEEKESHEVTRNTEYEQRMLIITSVLRTRKKQYCWKKWLAFSRRRYATSCFAAPPPLMTMPRWSHVSLPATRTKMLPAIHHEHTGRRWNVCPLALCAPCGVRTTTQQ